mgnify:CR=1 FL=1
MRGEKREGDEKESREEGKGRMYKGMYTELSNRMVL